ncbi:MULTISPECIES: hypothetical protein [Halorussus]|uniref:hypothetical protein n=1 Tax=Halorussus TaxID=1070314 RepID=UPI00209CFC28|nr:hypothetical protein [Halorussus vallis]USZ77899.1 hypothetical protein NGM07_22225 [Halorussus vallis]
MTRDEAVPVSGRLVRPTPVDGTVVDVDFGYLTSVVLTVEKDGERYYETYGLVSVEREADVG